MGQELTFTRYVRASIEAGEPVGGALLEAVEKEMRGKLFEELRARKLWAQSPRTLGIVGFESWHENDEEALGELVRDCFLKVFLHRLPTYEKRLSVMENVEGLVFRNIKNYLHDTQKRCDQVGFRVFLVLRASVVAAVESERLRRLGGDPAIRNDTLLGFGPRARESAAFAKEVEEALRSWAQETVPDFAPKMLRVGEKGIEKLAGQLGERWADLERSFEEVAGDGIEPVFWFGDLVGSFKREARRFWTSALSREMEIGETGRSLESPLTNRRGFEARETYQALRECVETKIEHAEESTTTRDRLDLVWTTFVDLAQDEETNRVSDRFLAKNLDLTRRQVAKLRGILERLVIRCGGRP